MNYLKFDKTLLTNLEESLPIEYLRTNKLGAYSATTVTGCNTRKYHGLLVTPVPELDDDNHVLLSSLDETVIQHGAEFNPGSIGKHPRQSVRAMPGLEWSQGRVCSLRQNKKVIRLQHAATGGYILRLGHFRALFVEIYHIRLKIAGQSFSFKGTYAVHGRSDESKQIADLSVLQLEKFP